MSRVPPSEAETEPAAPALSFVFPAVPDPLALTEPAVPVVSGLGLGSAVPDPEVSISVTSCQGAS